MYDPIEVLEQNPGSVVFARYAEELADEDRLSEAVAVLEDGTRANPFYAAGHAVFAGILLRQGDDKRALEAMTTSLSLDPQQPRVLVEFGKHFAKSEPKEAFDFLSAALRYAPELDEVRELANSIDLDFESEIDLQLSDVTEQALRSVSGEAQVIDEAGMVDEDASLLSEEDVLDALMGEGLPDSTSDELDACETLVSSGDEPELSGDESADTISAADDEGPGIDMMLDSFEQNDDAYGGTKELPEPEEPVIDAEDNAIPPGSASESGIFIEDSGNDSEEGNAVSEESVTKETIEKETVTEEDLNLVNEAAIPETEEHETGADVLFDTVASEGTFDNSTEKLDVENNSDSEDSRVTARDTEDQLSVRSADDGVLLPDEGEVHSDGSGDRNELAGHAGEDITEEFLAYAQMIEAESVNEASPTYDKLISGEFDGAGKEVDDSSTISSTPFDLDEEWLHAISSSDDGGDSGHGSDKNSENEGFNRELMDYVKLFEDSSESDVPAEHGTDAPIIDIDETTDYNPSQFEIDSESILSEEERTLLERETPHGTSMNDSDMAGDDLKHIQISEENQNNTDEEQYGLSNNLESFVGALSHEELEELSQSGTEEKTDSDLKYDTTEGIDYGSDQGRDIEEGYEDDGILLEIGGTEQADVEQNEETGESFQSTAGPIDGNRDSHGTIHESDAPHETQMVEDLVNAEDSTSAEDELEVEEDIENLSIDDLLDEYVSTLKNEASIPIAESTSDGVSGLATEDNIPHDTGQDVEAEDCDSSARDKESVPVDEEILSMPTHTIELEETPTLSSKPYHVTEHGEDDDDITATIAEIYVAQGFIQKAINVYRKLSERDSDNDAIRSRLTGLQQQLDRQSDKL